jgi:kumamolisin
VIPGSTRRLPPGTHKTGELAGNERIVVTVIVRPRTPEPISDRELYKLGRLPLAERRHISLGEYRERYGADQRDLDAVMAYARARGLSCVADSALRTVELLGDVFDLCAAFDARLAYYVDAGGNDFLGRTGPLRVPGSLAAIVTAVTGFHKGPRPSFSVPPKANPTGVTTSYSPARIARFYGFPSRYDGSGESIAVIAGGGYKRSDLEEYFRRIGRRDMPKIVPVSVGGSRNRPGRDRDLDTELMLDLEILGTVAPGAKLFVYLAPRATNSGWISAVRAAVLDKHPVSVISISMGAPEKDWTPAERTRLEQAFRAAAVMGITVCCASGDWGTAGGIGDREPYVCYPAASPYVLACGGTRMTVADRKRRVDEVVWNDHDRWASGGGMSTIFPPPRWQTGALAGIDSINRPPKRGRGVPDVAAVAAAQYTIQIPGGYLGAHGGTSAATPLWAALIARLNQALGKDRSAGYLNPLLYESVAPTGFNDIDEGSNGGYRARRGWDACTGLGTPMGGELISALLAGS